MQVRQLLDHWAAGGGTSTGLTWLEAEGPGQGRPQARPPGVDSAGGWVPREWRPPGAAVPVCCWHRESQRGQTSACLLRKLERRM